MAFIGGIFFISFIVFLVKLGMAANNHGVDGMRDSMQRMKEGKKEVRTFFKPGVDAAKAGTEMRFCPYCGAQRTTDTCGKCKRA